MERCLTHHEDERALFLIVTSAARQTRLWAKPVAIADAAFALHGAITMPSVRKLPLEIGAAWSPSEWTTSASSFTCDQE